MRWPVDLDLLPATDRFGAAFRLVTIGVVTLFVGELDETKGELSPMSPSNHVQSPARAACVNAIAAIDVISSLFISILVMANPLWLTLKADRVSPLRRVRGIVYCCQRIKESSLFRGRVRYRLLVLFASEFSKPCIARDARADGMEIRDGERFATPRIRIGIWKCF